MVVRHFRFTLEKGSSSSTDRRELHHGKGLSVRITDQTQEAVGLGLVGRVDEVAHQVHVIAIGVEAAVVGDQIGGQAKLLLPGAVPQLDEIEHELAVQSEGGTGLLEAVVVIGANDVAGVPGAHGDHVLDVVLVVLPLEGRVKVVDVQRGVFLFVGNEAHAGTVYKQVLPE